MSLTKSKGNMYPWVTHTHSHIAGKCSHECSYCYVQSMAARFPVMKEKYSGLIRLTEDALMVDYGSGKTIFIDHLNDLWADAVPDEWILNVLEHCGKYGDNTYVFQTKNPKRYLNWLDWFPRNCILGCTIETNSTQTAKHVSCAPSPIERTAAMSEMSQYGFRTFVTVEPILDLDPSALVAMLRAIKPEFVNIGADSKKSDLQEPSADVVRELIDQIEAAGIEIREKHNLERLLKC